MLFYLRTVAEINPYVFCQRDLVHYNPEPDLHRPQFPETGVRGIDFLCKTYLKTSDVGEGVSHGQEDHFIYGGYGTMLFLRWL